MKSTSISIYVVESTIYKLIVETLCFNIIREIIGFQSVGGFLRPSRMVWIIKSRTDLSSCSMLKAKWKTSISMNASNDFNCSVEAVTVKSENCLLYDIEMGHEARENVLIERFIIIKSSRKFLARPFQCKSKFRNVAVRGGFLYDFIGICWRFHSHFKVVFIFNSFVIPLSYS